MSVLFFICFVLFFCIVGLDWDPLERKPREEPEPYASREDRFAAVKVELADEIKNRLLAARNNDPKNYDISDDEIKWLHDEVLCLQLDDLNRKIHNARRV